MLVIVYNPCISQPCQHGGKCINTTDGFECKCKGNHNGTTCSGRSFAVPVSVLHFPEKTGLTHIISSRRSTYFHTQIPTEMFVECMIVINIILNVM